MILTGLFILEREATTESRTDAKRVEIISRYDGCVETFGFTAAREVHGKHHRARRGKLFERFVLTAIVEEIGWSNASLGAAVAGAIYRDESIGIPIGKRLKYNGIN